MKKLFLGAILLFCGTIGILSLTTLSIYNPWNYNGITGIFGFLLGSETLWLYILFCVMFVLSIVISFYEAYVSKN